MSGASILYINYDPELAGMRELLIHRLGHEVISVMGDADARRIAMARHFDLVILGHAASEAKRRRMAQWLKAHMPGVEVLALCPAPFQTVDYGDYQADAHNPEAWLRLVQEALSKKKM